MASGKVALKRVNLPKVVLTVALAVVTIGMGLWVDGGGRPGYAALRVESLNTAWRAVPNSSETPPAENAGGGKGAAPSAPADDNLIFNMDAIVVNLNEEESIRYLKVRMDLEMNAPSARAEIEKKQALFRDEANIYLSGLSYDQVKGTQEKIALKEEMLRRFNAALSNGRISRIYFVEFVIQ